MSEDRITTRLSAVVSMFEAYETPLTQAQIEEAISVVCELQEVVKHIPTPRNPFIAAALYVASVPEHAKLQAEATTSAAIDLMVQVEYAREQTDKIRGLLAAYTPHAQSRAQRYMRHRRALCYELRALADTSGKIHAAKSPGDVLPRRREHPAYLRLLPTEHDQPGQEDDANNAVTPAAPAQDADKGFSVTEDQKQQGEQRT